MSINGVAIQNAFAAGRCEELFEADRYATSIGIRPNTFVTIRWRLTAEAEANIADRWTAMLKAIRAWSRSKGIGDLAYVYVHENPPRTGGGFNSHLLISVPATLRALLAAKLEAILGASPGAVLVEPRCYPGKRDTRLQYMCKGTDMATAMKFGLIHPTKGWKSAQGEIHHKRSGTSTNIGKSARRSERQRSLQILIARGRSNDAS